MVLRLVRNITGRIPTLLLGTGEHDYDYTRPSFSIPLATGLLHERNRIEPSVPQYSKRPSSSVDVRSEPYAHRYSVNSRAIIILRMQQQTLLRYPLSRAPLSSASTLAPLGRYSSARLGNFVALYSRFGCYSRSFPVRLVC